MVKRILIDTNVWLRFILKDNQSQFLWSKKIIGLIEEGRLSPYISAITFLEINFVLTKIYQIKTTKTERIINDILAARNLVVLDKTDFKKAYAWNKKYQVKLADCLIASSLPKNCWLISWDQELKKIKQVQTVSPREFLE